jgi:hypothetical protein
MASSRSALFSGLVIVVVALSSACSGNDDSGSDSSGTGPDDGKFGAPPTKPEDGQKSSTSSPAPTQAQKKEAPPSMPTTPPTGAAGSCAAPQCTGIAGLCGCRGGSQDKQTIMACAGGKCHCNNKTLDDSGACGTTVDAAKLATLFASCGCH